MSLLELVTRELQSLEDRGLRRRLRSLDTSQQALIRLDGRDVVNFSANNLDPMRDPGPYSRGRGRKLVLCVLEQDKPSWLEYTEGAAGLSEDVVFIPVSPRDLPDSVLGYDAIDSILWLDAEHGITTPQPAIP